MSKRILNQDTTAAFWEAAEPAEIPAAHPGEILKADFLDPLGVSINRFATDLGITYRRAHEIVTGKRGVSPETALLLAKYLGTSPQFWLNLQNHFDLEELRGTAGEKMSRVRPVGQPALSQPIIIRGPVKPKFQSTSTAGGTKVTKRPAQP